MTYNFAAYICETIMIIVVTKLLLLNEHGVDFFVEIIPHFFGTNLDHSGHLFLLLNEN